jgi:hypothetical protein
MMRHLGLDPDPWQLEVLESGYRRLLLNCSRQAGKSTVVAILALAETIFALDNLVLLLAPSSRQSEELFRKVLDFYHELGKPLLKRCNSEELLLTTGSRIVPLPAREETIRGFSNVRLLIIDEASRVPDHLYRAVRPMLAVSDGRLICLSTPYGRRGFFYEAWARGGDDWTRVEIPADRISRIKPAFLAEERRQHSESFVRQEYFCSFEALEGLVYPDFARCIIPGPAPAGRAVGGLDFGVRNPFAAVWGVLDRDDVLWLTGEHYSRGQTLAYHRARLPQGVMWYCDPSGARERIELLAAGLKVRAGINDVRLGIGAVKDRLATGRLRVVEGKCPNLLYEAGLYRYEGAEEARGSESPLGEQDHALDALRYLVSRLDKGRLGRGAKLPPPREPGDDPTASPPKRAEPWWKRWGNPDLWTPIN